MSINQDKISNFQRLVLNEAEEEKNRIIEEITKEKKTKLEVIEKQLSDVADREITREKAKIERSKNERIIKKQMDQKQMLLNEREHLIDEIFVKVRDDLKAYAKTEDYVSHIETVVKHAIDQFATTELVVILNQDDKNIAGMVESLGVKVEFAETQLIGGCKIIDPNRGIQIDETFETKLNDARSNFLETCNLKI